MRSARIASQRAAKRLVEHRRQQRTDLYILDFGVVEMSDRGMVATANTGKIWHFARVA